MSPLTDYRSVSILRGMPKWMNIAFWAAVIMLVDAAIGLWGLNYWERIVPNLNVKRIALVEVVVSLVILGTYFIMKAVTS